MANDIYSIATILIGIIGLVISIIEYRKKASAKIADIEAVDPVLTLIGMLNDDADERREYAANQLYKYARMSKEKAEEICEIFCTHIRKNSNIYFNPNSDIIMPREFTKIVKWLFEKDGIFQNINKDLSGTVFLGIKFGKNSISNVNFTDCKFIDCYFQNTALKTCKMSKVKIAKCTFKNNVDFNGCLLNEATISETLFRNINFKNCSLIKSYITANTTFSRSDLRDTIFENSHISDTKFIICDLGRCDFAYSALTNVYMKFSSSAAYDEQVRYFRSIGINPELNPISNSILA